MSRYTQSNVSGSYGPQIVTRVPKKGVEDEYEIKKAVVDPKWLPIAGAIQAVLIAEITDVKEKITLKFGNDGQDFVDQAEKDEPVLRSFKEIFINLVSAEPSKVESVTLAALKAKWLATGYPKKLAAEIFDTGKDLRPTQETVTL